MARLTTDEQARILRALGYPNWIALASSFQLGYPAPSQPEYLVRDAFDRITDEGLELVRRDLREVESCELQLSDARTRLKATKVGEILTNQGETAALRGELAYWTKRLADDLGVYPNPLSNSVSDLPGGRCAKVLG